MTCRCHAPRTARQGVWRATVATNGAHLVALRYRAPNEHGPIQFDLADLNAILTATAPPASLLVRLLAGPAVDAENYAGAPWSVVANATATWTERRPTDASVPQGEWYETDDATAIARLATVATSAITFSVPLLLASGADAAGAVAVDLPFVTLHPNTAVAFLVADVGQVSTVAVQLQGRQFL